MKKILAIVLCVMLAAALAVSASATVAILEEVAPDAMAEGLFGDSYPYSPDYDWPACTSDEIIKGTVITGISDAGSHCWSDGTDNASCAFDGDTMTFFDPYEASTDSWCGLKLDQAYELSEVRICNRSGQEVRIIGAAIQGSNDDGATWYTVVYFDPAIYGSTALLTNDYHVVTPAKNDAYFENNLQYMDESQADFSVYWIGGGSYSMYRYVNLVGTHGDCAEIELYGHPAEANNQDPSKEIVEPLKSTVDEFVGTVDKTGTDAAITDGSIAGKVIGGGGAWSDSASYACAFDGDVDTFYDPAAAGPECFTGIQTAEPYALTEVRVRPRTDWNARTNGATIQGSNNGINWTTLAYFGPDDILADDAEPVYLSMPVTDTNGYVMFRYVSDGTSHGDVAEVVFIGAPAAAASEISDWALSSDPSTTEDGQLLGKAVYGTPTIDGVIDDCWADVPSYPVNRLKTGSETDLVANFKAMWNENNLYVLIEVQDDDSSFNGGRSQRDGTEVYMDLNYARTNGWDDEGQSYCAVDGNDLGSMAYDGNSMGILYLEESVTAAFTHSDTGWVYEYAIDTTKEFGIPLCVNKLIGFDVQANDQEEGSDSRNAAYGWQDFDDSAWQHPDSFGTLSLVQNASDSIDLDAGYAIVAAAAAEREAAEKAAEEAAAAAKAEEEAAKAAEEAAKAAEEKVEDVVEDVTEAANDVAEAVGDAAGEAVDAVADAAKEVADAAKSGCGSFIGGGIAVIVSILGAAWVAGRKH